MADIIEIIQHGLPSHLEGSDRARTQMEGLSSRLEKAVTAKREGRVYWNSSHDAAIVEGESNVHRIHIQELQVSSCNCKDSQLRRALHKGWCWHRLAAKLLAKETEKEADGYTSATGFSLVDPSSPVPVAAHRGDT